MNFMIMHYEFYSAPLFAVIFYHPVGYRQNDHEHPTMYESFTMDPEYDSALDYVEVQPVSDKTLQYFENFENKQ